MSTISKGNLWRRQTQLLLESLGFAVTVRGIGFAGDDLDARLGALHLSVEAKNHARYDFAGWVKQAESNAGDAVPVVVAHRNGKASVEDGYVVMSGRAFAQLVRALEVSDAVSSAEVRRWEVQE